MRSLKRLVAITLTSFILLSTTIVANAETSQEIQNSESKLEQNAELINQKETEQKMILTELQDMQSGLHEIENEMSKNKEEVSLMQQKFDETKKMIEDYGLRERLAHQGQKLLSPGGINRIINLLEPHYE